METSETLPIVDAHQHFWELSRNYHPWLCDPEPIPFRYGDYSRLRRSYMPADYRRDSAGFDFLLSVIGDGRFDAAYRLAPLGLTTPDRHPRAERLYSPNLNAVGRVL